MAYDNEEISIMDVLKRILACCLNACLAGASLRFSRSIKNGFCRAIYFFVDCCIWCYYRCRAYHHDRAGRKHWLQALQAVHKVRKRLVAGLLIAVLLPSLLITPVYAVTINTAQVGGKFYGLTGALNNPVVGSAITMGATALTKVNPWLNAISGGVIIYKIYEELAAGSVSVRPSGVSESVPTWTNNTPPSAQSSIPGATYYRVSGYGFAFDHTSKQAAGDAECPLMNSVFTGYDATNNWCVGSGTHSGDLTWDIYTAPTSCPAGYTLSGSTCNLSDASSVSYPSDGIPTYVVDANGNFVVDPRDPDFTGLVTGLPGQNTLTQVAPNGDSMTLQGQPGGGFSAQTQHAEIDPADGLLHQYTQSAMVNNMGAVTSYSSTNNVVNVINGVATPASTGTTFPTDYNRESTQQALKTAVTDDIAASNTAKTALGNGPTKPTYDASELHLPQQSSFQVAPTAPISGLLPTNSGDCVTLPVNLPYFSNLILDPCVVVTAARPFIDWGVMVLGLLAGIFVWFGKSEEV